MRDFIIIHDKLLEYGGAEVVLASLVKYRKPKAIICSCIRNKKSWEERYQTKIISPILTCFVNSQFLYKLFYPFIVLSCYLSGLALRYENAFFIVYSSSAGKYFVLPNYKNAFLYVNYHAKGLRNGRINFHRLSEFQILRNLLTQTQSLFVYFEDRMADRFKTIYAISSHASQSLRHLKIFSTTKAVGILHCPSIVLRKNRIEFDDKIFPFNDYYVLISRLQPEKNLEGLLDYLYVNTEVKIVIVGDGALIGVLRKKYPIKFFFTGFLEASFKNEIISNAIAVFQPTTQEWSLVTVESNLMGIPVISASSSGLREINSTISGSNDFPNLLYESFFELQLLIGRLEFSRSFLRNNAERINWLFSEKLFHERIRDIEKLECNG